MSEANTRESTDYDCDLVIGGGGPAGCSAGVFCARADLDTLIFDRGRSSLRRCAHLENYLGFPAGIDVETFYDLIHDHAERAGCEVVPDLVEVVLRREAGGFVIETQENRRMSARQVVTAARYNAEYLRPLDDEGEMFESYEYDGEEHERFDSDYPDSDGSTPIEGLYVASPSDEDDQAIMAAGRGARVAQGVIADARMANGWWEEAAEGVDWMRQEAGLDDEWAERETWIEWFDDYYGEDAPVSPGSERFRRVRETYIDEQFATYLSTEEIEARTERGHRALSEHVDPESIVGAVGEEKLLEAMDGVAIREYVTTHEAR
ncbi:MAG: NAD(P)/FAD-dependent oxidoreductase [Euryarchaeota archaeon]|nr:NAD(P)/FAD-dependent oxidoreductase [Euryarchaeota archaeon]